MRLQVLDHGYVEFVEAWGHGLTADYDDRMLDDDLECGIIEAARQSTQGSFRGWDQDQKLLSFLYKNNHATPFEFSGMVVEVQAPIFVFREWHRHRTQSYNEMSARYAPLPDLYYLPTVERVLMGGGANRQAGSVGDAIDQPGAEQFISILASDYRDAEDSYQEALENGVPKELARLIMPVGHYSRMRASTNLRSWLGFLTLRLDPKAQWEIRQYAEAVAEIVSVKFPRTWQLFEESHHE